MGRRVVYTEESFVEYGRPSKSYGCIAFVFDIIMTFISGGLWLIWIFVREMRRR